MAFTRIHWAEQKQPIRACAHTESLSLSQAQYFHSSSSTYCCFKLVKLAISSLCLQWTHKCIFLHDFLAIECMFIHNSIIISLEGVSHTESKNTFHVDVFRFELQLRSSDANCGNQTLMVLKYLNCFHELCVTDTTGSVGHRLSLPLKKNILSIVLPTWYFTTFPSFMRNAHQLHKTFVNCIKSDSLQQH